MGVNSPLTSMNVFEQVSSLDVPTLNIPSGVGRNFPNFSQAEIKAIRSSRTRSSSQSAFDAPAKQIIDAIRQGARTFTVSGNPSPVPSTKLSSAKAPTSMMARATSADISHISNLVGKVKDAAFSFAKANSNSNTAAELYGVVELANPEQRLSSVGSNHEEDKAMQLINRGNEEIRKILDGFIDRNPTLKAVQNVSRIFSPNNPNNLDTAEPDAIKDPGRLVRLPVGAIAKHKPVDLSRYPEETVVKSVAKEASIKDPQEEDNNYPVYGHERNLPVNGIVREPNERIEDFFNRLCPIIREKFAGNPSRERLDQFPTLILELPPKV